MINKDYKIKIECFTKDHIFDNRAIESGIYIIELLKNDVEESAIPLYIGQSKHMLKRSGDHLYNTFQTLGYLGLSKEHMEDPKLTIRLRVLKKCEHNELYTEEKKQIKKIKPILQNSASDRMITDVEIKRNKVKEALEKI